MSDTPAKLSLKHRAFVDEYCRLFNGTRAYMRVYKHSSERSAGVLASNLLGNVSIQEAIKAKFAELHMGEDEVLQILSDQARGDLGTFMDVSTVGFTFDLLQRDKEGNLILDGNGKPMKRPETKLIKKIKQRVTTYIGKKDDSEDREVVENEIELYDAQAAAEKIGRHLKLFKDDESLNMNIDVSQLTTEQLERIAKGENVLSVLAATSTN